MFSFNYVYVSFMFIFFFFYLDLQGSNPEVDFLSRENYRNISIKKYPVFSYDRDQIYDLFQKYEAEKARKGDYDSIDRYV
jgi:hypothetical protein